MSSTYVLNLIVGGVMLHTTTTATTDGTPKAIIIECIFHCQQDTLLQNNRSGAQQSYVCMFFFCMPSVEPAGLIAPHCCWSKAASRGYQRGGWSTKEVPGNQKGLWLTDISAICKDKREKSFCPCWKWTVPGMHRSGFNGSFHNGVNNNELVIHKEDNNRIKKR